MFIWLKTVRLQFYIQCKSEKKCYYAETQIKIFSRIGTCFYSLWQCPGPTFIQICLFSIVFADLHAHQLKIEPQKGQ